MWEFSTLFDSNLQVMSILGHNPGTWVNELHRSVCMEEGGRETNRQAHTHGPTQSNRRAGRGLVSEVKYAEALDKLYGM